MNLQMRVEAVQVAGRYRQCKSENGGMAEWQSVRWQEAHALRDSVKKAQTKAIERLPKPCPFCGVSGIVKKDGKTRKILQ